MLLHSDSLLLMARVDHVLRALGSVEPINERQIVTLVAAFITDTINNKVPVTEAVLTDLIRSISDASPYVRKQVQEITKKAKPTSEWVRTEDNGQRKELPTGIHNKLFDFQRQIYCNYRVDNIKAEIIFVDLLCFWVANDKKVRTRKPVYEHVVGGGGDSDDVPTGYYDYGLEYRVYDTAKYVDKIQQVLSSDLAYQQHIV